MKVYNDLRGKRSKGLSLAYICHAIHCLLQGFAATHVKHSRGDGPKAFLAGSRLRGLTSRRRIA